MKQENKWMLDDMRFWHHAKKIILWLLLVGFLALIVYGAIHGHPNKLPEGTILEDANGTLTGVGDSKAGHERCFITLDNGEKLILLCSQSYFVNIPIKLIKVTTPSQEPYYVIKDEFANNPNGNKPSITWFGD